MRNEFSALYELMANSKNVAHMHLFGEVTKEIMEWMIQNRPSEAQAWIEKLEAVRYRNYLTPKEADMIVGEMDPSAPWTREQWQSAMQQHGFPLEEEPYYNRCALYVTMAMEMSDSSDTIKKYIDGSKQFAFVHDHALDKLKDKDFNFNVREYFNV